MNLPTLTRAGHTAPPPLPPEWIEAATKVTRARSLLILDQPWFGTLALRLTFLPAPYVGTLATDGTRLLYSPQFVLRQPMPQLCAGIAHEVLHCALLHPFRFGAKDHGEWNISCDFAINGILTAAGMVLPDGSLIDQQYDGLSAEAIYAKRGGGRKPEDPPPPDEPEDEPGEEKSDEPGDEPDPRGTPGDDEDPDGTPSDQPGDHPNPDKPGPDDGDAPSPGRPDHGTPGQQPGDIGVMIPAGQGKAPGQGDQPGDGDQPGGPPPGPQPEDLTAGDWQVMGAQATNAANKAGKMSGDLARVLDASRQSTTDWREVLRRFVADAVTEDTTWTPPNRRFIAQGMYLPGQSRDGTARIGVLIDTSGSVNQPMLDTFASELTEILREVRPEALDIVYCDARVQHTETWAPDDADSVALVAHGGGGTNMQPGFDWFTDRAESGEAAVACVICLTDLDFWRQPDEPGYPVLWGTFPWIRREGPFGETVRIDVEDPRASGGYLP